MRDNRWFVSFVLGLSCVAGLTLADPPQPTEPEPGVEQGMWDQILLLYEGAKESTADIPEDVTEWIEQDFHKIGDWEYRLLELPSAEATALEKKLNELGQERWECFWVGPAGNGATRFFFKRPSRSYLTNLPLMDLLKLVPKGDDSSD